MLYFIPLLLILLLFVCCVFGEAVNMSQKVDKLLCIWSAAGRIKNKEKLL
jgi:hypothetical protein